MTALSPTEIAAKWSQNLASAAPTMTAGVNALNVSPGAMAARQDAVWAQNTMAARQKWKTNVGATTLDYWRSQYLNKGLPNVATGASAAQPKMADFMTKLRPYQDSARASLPPRGTYEQNKARLTAWVDKMHAFSYKSGA